MFVRPFECAAARPAGRDRPIAWLSVAAVVALTAGCSSGPAKAPPSEPLDRDVIAAAAAGQQAFARGAYYAAAEQYRCALTRARLQDDPALIGDHAFNLAVCLAALGDADGASAHLTEAEAALCRAGLPLADVLLVSARLAYRRSAAHADATSLDEAVAAAARVLDDPQSRPTAMHEGEVALLRAEIACDRRDAAAAAEHLARARGLAAPLPGAPLAAGLARATGRIAALRGQPDAAARAFDEEAGLQRRARRYPDMAKALLRSAAAHADAARPGVAADRYYRAALTLSAQEKAAQALAALDAARAASAKASDPSVPKLVANLRAELAKDAAQPGTSTAVKSPPPKATAPAPDATFLTPASAQP